MCGICGFVGPSDISTLKQMTDTIIHRGPDEDGYYSDGQINFGMRRLSIIDVASGQQPVHNEDQSIWTIFNGEIYNYLELRRQLENRGHRFYTDHADTEVLVHLYEEYGEDFLSHLNGMFAIAIWDRQRNQLFLARDRMGVKPLFFAFNNGQLIFGSEIKSILAHPSYVKGLNHRALYHYFTFKNIPAPLTAFQGIHSLLPGQSLFYKSGEEPLFKRYWKIKFAENSQRSEQETKEQIMDILQDAVQQRLVSDVPVGAYLSGGVDSSAVAALMAKHSNGVIKTFCLGYEDDLINKQADMHYAREMSRILGTDHHEYIMSSKEVPDAMEGIIRAFDQPFSGTVSTFFLSKLIRRHVKVALSGDGADELFGSYLAHRLAQPMQNFSLMQSRIADNSLTQGDRALLAPFSDNVPYLQGLFEQSGGDVVKWRNAILTFSENDKENLLSDEFRQSMGNESSTELLGYYFRDTTTKDPLNRILEVDWNSLLPDQVLAFVDSLSMAHSVEVRSPFLDYRLAEFVATIPGRMKIKNGVVKYILKESVRSILPKDIIDRPKEGFVLPVFHWLQKPLKPYAIDILTSSSIQRYGILNEKYVNELMRDFFGGNAALASKMWNIIMFQVWCESYLS